ncbi:MAG: DnaJ domain-containing protein [Myxococcales bacterium]|nr:DnaJ domain-containing protein [Myxococcales bacterium]
MEALPPPTAAGLLAKTPLAHLFTYVMERRLSGSLVLRRPDGWGGAIVFFEGLPRKADAPPEIAPSDPGALAALEAQVQCLFTFPPATQFAFYEGRDTLQERGPGFVEADPLRLLWAGVRMNPSWDHANAALARLQTVAIRLKASAAPERCGFDASELQIVELLRHRPLFLGDLTAARLVPPALAHLFVYFMLITKQLDLLEAPPGMKAPPIVPLGPQAHPQQPPQPSFHPHAAHAPHAHAQHAAPPPGMSPMPQAYAVPGAPPATRQHPPSDAPFNPFSDLSLGPPPPVPATPFAPTSSPKLPPNGAAGVAAAPDAPRKPTLSDADSALWDKVVAKAASIDEEDHYQALGIAPATLKEDIQKAFFALAKTWHPDKLPSTLGELRDACSKVFARITEAHAVLTDVARREEYDKNLRDGTGGAAEQAEVQRALEAANNFQKALVYLKRNDTATCEELARKALEADSTQADYLALVTWLDAQKPHNLNFERTRELILKLDNAIAMNGSCERAHFYRGMLHKRTENPKQALKDFKRAVELNPHNLDAAREIRLHGMRQPSKGEEGVGGLLGRFFKK